MRAVTITFHSSRSPNQQRPAWTAAEKQLAKNILGRFCDWRGEEVVAGWNLTGKLPRTVERDRPLPRGGARRYPSAGPQLT